MIANKIAELPFINENTKPTHRKNLLEKTLTRQS
jgi:hypothetical protein